MYAKKFVPEVTAWELDLIKLDRELLESTRAFAKELAAELADHEQDVIARIEEGAVVDGDAQVITKRRQNVSWLTAFKERLGTEGVKEVKNDWPITFAKALQIG